MLGNSSGLLPAFGIARSCFAEVNKTQLRPELHLAELSLAVESSIGREVKVTARTVLAA